MTSETTEPTGALRSKRQDQDGRAFAGSQRHLQTYVASAALRETLDVAITQQLRGLAGSEVEWLSPLPEARYAELSDKRFWTAIERLDLAEKAADWWPSRGGPVWDGVAIATPADGERIVVLIEAKANVPEFGGGGLAATSPVSIEMIESALDATRSELSSEADLAAWTGPNYQLANRLAWTKWLRDHAQPAVFVHVLFLDDPTRIATSAADLRAAANASREALGVPVASIDEWTTTIVLPAV